MVTKKIIFFPNGVNFLTNMIMKIMITMVMVIGKRYFKKVFEDCWDWEFFSESCLDVVGLCWILSSEFNLWSVGKVALVVELHEV